jgi:hypothetical protein
MSKNKAAIEVLKTLGVFASLGVIGLGVMYRKEIYGVVTGKKIVSNKAVKKAKEEFEKWDQGKIKEHDSRTLDSLDSYWKSVGKTYNSMKNEAWSAAFISWLMQESGSKDTFKKSASHSVYIRDSIKNKKENIGSWKGYKPEDVKVKVGDLICYARQNGVNYDSQSSYSSHCDIVINVDKKKQKVRAIGGNVGNSVTASDVSISKDGYLNSDKHFVVIKNK